MKTRVELLLEALDFGERAVFTLDETIANGERLLIETYTRRLRVLEELAKVKLVLAELNGNRPSD